MLERGQLLFAETFSSAKPIFKPRWWPKQSIQWSVKDGTLVGIAATEEYQQQRCEIGHLLGDIPRIGMGNLPSQYVMTCRFQIDDRPGDAKVPLVEIGHHVSRIYFGKSGAVLLTNNEKTAHTRANEFQLKPFTWYTVLAEVGEEHLVALLVDDEGKRMVFQAHEPQFATAKNMSFEIATTIQGTAKLNDIKVWSAGEIKLDWMPARESPTHDSQSKTVQTMKSPLSAATTLWIASLIAITASAQEARGPGVRRSRRGRAGLRPEQETAKCDVHSV